jgi:hypothetical protein
MQQQQQTSGCRRKQIGNRLLLLPAASPTFLELPAACICLVWMRLSEKRQFSARTLQLARTEFDNLMKLKSESCKPVKYFPFPYGIIV